MKKIRRFFPLLLAAALLLTACGPKAAAATMHLTKTEGTVGVSDGEGKEVTLREKLGLYSGYGVGTQSESYAWIDLDEVKLTKMDQDSEIAIQKEDKKLEIEVKSGSLFFNVTEPLAEDETMEIRTSSMLVGIRGTCGWVTQDTACLLEGTVTVTAGDQSAAVSAGEMAAVTAEGMIDVRPFTPSSIPAFVLEEVQQDGELAKAILDDSGIDVLNPVDPVGDALAQYRTIAGQADHYFDDLDYSGDDVPEIIYHYALVQMQAESQIPALVLEQETNTYWWGNLCTALVFQYDPDSQTVIRAEGQLSEGVASAGGYRGGLELAGDGLGILETSWSSGTGMGSIRRATVAGSALQFDTVFDGFLFDDTQPAIASLPIDWRDVSDLSGLDSWTPSAAPVQTPDAGEPDSPAESGGPLAGYAGTYTAYESFHEGYGGGSRLPDVTLDENGFVTGGGTSYNPLRIAGVEPSSVAEQEDGSIVIAFSEDETFTIYPPGVIPEAYTSDYWKEHLDPNAVHLNYFCFDGGVMDVLYHADPASLS